MSDAKNNSMRLNKLVREHAQNAFALYWASQHVGYLGGRLGCRGWPLFGFKYQILKANVDY